MNVNEFIKTIGTISVGPLQAVAPFDIYKYIADAKSTRKKVIWFVAPFTVRGNDLYAMVVDMGISGNFQLAWGCTQGQLDKGVRVIVLTQL